MLGQTLPAAQVIVVDDGSTDATANLLRGFGDRIEIVRQPNRGKAAALNHGLTLARGEAIWIFDDDDLADPRALERLTGALDANPGAGFAFGRHDVFLIGGDGRARAARRDPPEIMLGDLYFALLNDCFFFQGAMLVRRRCYDAAGTFDETLSRAQDYDMMLRLARRFRGVAVDAALFHQRQHRGDRGPQAGRIASSELAERQLGFDARVIRKAYDEAALSDLLPGDATMPLSDPERMRALFRRSALMGRRRLWDIADDDLAEAIGLAARSGTPGLSPEAALLFSRLFERSTNVASAKDNPVLARISALPPGAIRRDLETAVSWPFLRDGLKSGMRFDPRLAYRQLRLYACVGRGRGLPRHVQNFATWIETLNRKRLRLSRHWPDM